MLFYIFWLQARTFDLVEPYNILALIEMVQNEIINLKSEKIFIICRSQDEALGLACGKSLSLQKSRPLMFLIYNFLSTIWIITILQAGTWFTFKNHKKKTREYHIGKKSCCFLPFLSMEMTMSWRGQYFIISTISVCPTEKLERASFEGLLTSKIWILGDCFSATAKVILELPAYKYTPAF